MRAGYLKISNINSLIDLIFKDQKVVINPDIVKQLVQISKNGGTDVSFINDVLSDESKEKLFSDTIYPLQQAEYITDIKSVSYVTSLEKLYLKEKFHLSNNIGTGFQTIANIDGRPIACSFEVVIDKNGDKYLFIEPTSVLVDYDILDEFVSKTFKCKVNVVDANSLYVK